MLQLQELKLQYKIQFWDKEALLEVKSQKCHA